MAGEDGDGGDTVAIQLGEQSDARAGVDQDDPSLRRDSRPNDPAPRSGCRWWWWRGRVDDGGNQQPEEQDSGYQQLQEQDIWILKAAQGINYLEPGSCEQLYQDLGTVMLVAGLLIGGTYQGLYTGYSGGASNPYNAQFVTFCTLNYIAFGLSVVAVFLGVTGVILLQILSGNNQRWPSEYSNLPEPPEAISSEQTAENQAATFAKVEKHVRALYFVWHAKNYGVLRPTLRNVIKGSFICAWLVLLLSLALTMGASGAALYHHMNKKQAIFTGVVGVIGTVLLLMSILPPFAALLLAGKFAARSGTTGPEHDWRTAGVMARVLNNFKPRSKVDLKAQVWYMALDLAKKEDNTVKLVSRIAINLQNELEVEHSAKIAPIMDKLSAWKDIYGDSYAVHVFLDRRLVPEALQYTRVLWTFWRRFDMAIEHNKITLEEFFSTRSYGDVWLGRAKEYRMLAEQLDIVNWYYKNKHIDESYAAHPHYCDGLVIRDGNALEEYHPNPLLDSDGQPVIPEDRGRRHAFGEYEEWLVKGSFCRPDRYRLIQEWEARQFMLHVTDQGLNLNSITHRRKPKSTLELALKLRLLLGTVKKFQDSADELRKLAESPHTSNSAAGTSTAMPAAASPLDQVIMQLENLKQAMVDLQRQQQELRSIAASLPVL